MAAHKGIGPTIRKYDQTRRLKSRQQKAKSAFADYFQPTKVGFAFCWCRFICRHKPYFELLALILTHDTSNHYYSGDFGEFGAGL